MLAIGTPEALDVVEETRTTFTEAIQIVPEEARVRPPLPEPDLADPEQLEPNQPEPELPELELAESEFAESEITYDLVEPEEPLRVTGAAELPQLSLDIDDEAAEVPEEPAIPEEAEAEPEIELFPQARTESDAVIELETENSGQRVFAPENSGSEPTPPPHRTGRSVRLFWLWFATNSSVVSLIFGALLLSLGMSLRQAIVATLAGVALSFLPLGIGTLASKWNGQPTLVLSRASFGLAGNILPSLLALATRLLWGAVLLWLLASITAAILFDADPTRPLSELQLTIVVAGASFLIALIVAFFGYALLARVQLVLSVLSGALILLLIVISWPLVDLQAALTVADGPWTLVLTGTILVFSFVGLTWASGSGDLARYQRPSSSGAAAMLVAPFGTALPSFLLIAYGALLAASDRRLAFTFVADPVDALTSIVPPWFTVPLIGAVGIGLLSGVILSIYSGGFAVQAVVSRLRRDVAVLIAGIVLGTLAITMTLLSVDLTQMFRDLATTVAVPTAAWVGIFVAEVMIRNRRFDARSLLQRGGVYSAVRWVNLSMLIVASAVGYGLTTATVGWLSWQGYLLGFVGIPAGSELARADIGVIVALLLALLTPIIAGIPAIRRQEEIRGTPAEAATAPR